MEASAKTVECYKIGESYTLRKLVGSGSFGRVYSAVDEKGTEFAVKLERISNRRQRLLRENEIYKLLEGGKGIPRAYWYGQTGDLRFNALVLDILGPSLHQLFDSCNHRFSLKTVILLADQLLYLLQFLHSRGIIHRDIKPANFLMGTKSRHTQVYMIDFGLSERYRDSEWNHVPNVDRQEVGTPLFSSLNTHERNTPSRRDDMESLAYMLIFFLKGTLPWGNITSQRVLSRWKKVAEKKMKISVHDLCEDCPVEFRVLLKYCRKLEYDELPNYHFFKVMFRVLAGHMKYRYDYRFDWIESNGELVAEREDDDADQASYFYRNMETLEMPRPRLIKEAQVVPL